MIDIKCSACWAEYKVSNSSEWMQSKCRCWVILTATREKSENHKKILAKEKSAKEGKELQNWLVISLIVSLPAILIIFFVAGMTWSWKLATFLIIISIWILLKLAHKEWQNHKSTSAKTILWATAIYLVAVSIITLNQIDKFDNTQRLLNDHQSQTKKDVEIINKEDPNNNQQ